MSEIGARAVVHKRKKLNQISLLAKQSFLKMPQDFEVKFKEELYKKYKKCSKYMIPKAEYCAPVAEIKKTKQNPKSKSKHEYYMLTN